MPRPPKWRRVSSWPGALFYKPRAIPLSQLEINVLTIGEYEAIRLADVEDLDQARAAKMMGVSRATFGRILESAHKKIAEAMVMGKAIQIEGGNYKITGVRIFSCGDCGRTWSVPFDGGKPAGCPSCGGQNFHRRPDQPISPPVRPGFVPGRGPGRRRRGYRGGRRP